MVETERHHCPRCRAVQPHRFLPGVPPTLRCAGCGRGIEVEDTIPRAEDVFTRRQMARLAFVRWEYARGLR